jgi:hypothetical protein
VRELVEYRSSDGQATDAGVDHPDGRRGVWG